MDLLCFKMWNALKLTDIGKSKKRSMIFFFRRRKEIYDLWDRNMVTRETEQGLKMSRLVSEIGTGSLEPIGK